MTEPAAKRAKVDLVGLQGLLSKSQFSDIELRFPSCSVRAHRAILAENSAYFQERLSGSIRIETMQIESGDITSGPCLVVIRLLYAPDTALVDLSELCKGDDAAGVSAAVCMVWRAACFLQVSNRIMSNIFDFLTAMGKRAGKKLKPLVLGTMYTLPEPRKWRICLFTRYCLATNYAIEDICRHVRMPPDAAIAVMQMRFFCQMVGTGPSPHGHNRKSIGFLVQFISDEAGERVADACWPISAGPCEWATDSRQRHGARVPVIWAPPQLLAPATYLDIKYTLPIPDFSVDVRVTWAMQGDRLQYTVTGRVELADLPLACSLRIGKSYIDLCEGAAVERMLTVALGGATEFVIEPTLCFKRK